MQAKWGSHGDYEIAAYCPSSPQECFDYVVKAFNTADRWRIPVFVMDSGLAAPARGDVFTQGSGVSSRCLIRLIDFLRDKVIGTCGALWVQYALQECVNTGEIPQIVWEGLELYVESSLDTCLQPTAELGVSGEGLPPAYFGD